MSGAIYVPKAAATINALLQSHPIHYGRVYDNRMFSERAYRLKLVAWAAITSYSALGQIPDSGPGEVAGIPVNYIEAKAGTYTIPDPLKLNDGRRVTDVNTWVAKRRPEIRKLVIAVLRSQYLKTRLQEIGWP